jgi:hypothetical protein
MKRNVLFAITQLAFLVLATLMLWLSAKWTALLLLVDMFFVVYYFRRDLFSQKDIDNNRNNERELDEEEIVNESKTNILAIQNYEPYYGVEVPMGSFDVEYSNISIEPNTEMAHNTEADIQEAQTHLPSDAQGDISEIDDPASKPIAEIESAFKVIYNPVLHTTQEKTAAAKTIEDITPTTLMQDIIANKEVQERIKQLMGEIHSQD